MLKKIKLFNLTLANSKLIFDETLKNNTLSILELAFTIKNALRIIKQFHVNKKKIIFVGNPLHINKRLSTIFKKTKHTFVPRSAWVAGHMTNKFAHANLSKKKYNSTKLFSIHRFKKKSSLVVIVDQQRNLTALNEFHSTSIPIISLNSKTKMFDETSVLKVPAKLTSIRSNISTFLFYSLLLKIFKGMNRKYLRIIRRRPKLKTINKKRTYGRPTNPFIIKPKIGGRKRRRLFYNKKIVLNSLDTWNKGAKAPQGKNPANTTPSQLKKQTKKVKV
jgi:ribosomal protein S2